MKLKIWMKLKKKEMEEIQAVEMNKASKYGNFFLCELKHNLEVEIYLNLSRE